MLRNIAAVIFGFFVGFQCNSLTLKLTRIMHPFPEGFNMHNTEALMEYTNTTPPKVFAVLIAGHFLGIFLSVFLAAKLAKSHQFVLSLFPALILFIATVSFLTMLPYPIWLFLVEIPGMIILAILAARLGSGAMPDYDL